MRACNVSFRSPPRTRPTVWNTGNAAPSNTAYSSLPNSAAAIIAGIQNALSKLGQTGPRNPGGATPMTSWARPSSSTSRPSTSGSDANCVRQSMCDRTTTGWAPGVTLSDGVMIRPRSGRTRSTEKKLPETSSPSCSSGNSPPPTVLKVRTKAARSAGPSPSSCRTSRKAA